MFAAVSEVVDVACGGALVRGRLRGGDPSSRSGDIDGLGDRAEEADGGWSVIFGAQHLRSICRVNSAVVQPVRTVWATQAFFKSSASSSLNLTRTESRNFALL
jgi:hypothetical protein